MLDYQFYDRRLRGLQARIQEACKHANRDSEDIELVLVTKEVAVPEIEKAYGLGIREFGENRVQELASKRKQLPGDIRWHFIGHLQRNKVKLLLETGAGSRPLLLHSLDRLELAEELTRYAEKKNQTVEALVQVNTSGESTKHGLRPETAKQAISGMTALGRLNLRGLMTIGPNTKDENSVRSSFRSLRLLRDRLRDEIPNVDWHYLSMGMSSDFEIAIEEGANLLRIGTAVFGPRTK